MLDNNDKVLSLVEYDGKSVSVIVICGGYFWPPRQGKKHNYGGGVESPLTPPAIPTLDQGL